MKNSLNVFNDIYEKTSFSELENRSIESIQFEKHLRKYGWIEIHMKL